MMLLTQNRVADEILQFSQCGAELRREQIIRVFVDNDSQVPTNCSSERKNEIEGETNHIVILKKCKTM